MHKQLSRELFSKHVSIMLDDKYLKDEGVSLVLQNDDFVVIQIPLKQPEKKVLLGIQNINFDIEPLNIFFVDSKHYRQLPPELYPKGSIIVGNHNVLPNPVICISSTYSYHTHPNHRSTPFELYRNGFELANLIKTVKRHLDSDWVVPEGAVLYDK